MVQNATTATATVLDSPQSSSTISELCERHKLSPTMIYAELRAGRLRSFTVGTTRRISHAAEREWIARLEADASDFKPLKKTPRAAARGSQ